MLEQRQLALEQPDAEQERSFAEITHEAELFGGRFKVVPRSV